MPFDKEKDYDIFSNYTFGPTEETMLRHGTHSAVGEPKDRLTPKAIGE